MKLYLFATDLLYIAKKPKLTFTDLTFFLGIFFLACVGFYLLSCLPRKLSFDKQQDDPLFPNWPQLFFSRNEKMNY